MAEENKKELEEFQNKVNEFIKKETVENIVKDNKVEFVHDEIKYRINKATFEQKMEMTSKRIKKYTELLRDPDQLLERDLIELYKKRGIDIKDMENKLSTLEKEKTSILIKLGEALKENKEEPILENLRDEAAKIIGRQQHIDIEKSLLLQNSIETQLNLYTYTYLAYLVTEKFVNDVWIKGWNTYDEFCKEHEELVNKVVWHSTLLTRIEE